MTDKEKLDAIRAEIHRLIDVRGYDRGMANDLFTFMDSLPNEPVSEDLEEAARRIATRHSHITGDTYYANDAWFFKKGAQWQKEQMINKACKWLKSYRQDTPDGTGYVAGIVNDKTIEEFKQAMEE